MAALKVAVLPLYLLGLVCAKPPVRDRPSPADFIPAGAGWPARRLSKRSQVKAVPSPGDDLLV